MRNATIARNYAEALFTAGEAKRQAEAYGEVLDGVAGAIAADERIAVALDSPRVSKAVKAKILEKALTGTAPKECIRFLQAIVRRGRQGLLAEIALEYQGLVDVKLNRVHAGVTLAADPDARLQKVIVEKLAAAIGKDVRAHFRADAAILGGVLVRVGDRIYDGSLKRRLHVLRRRMLTGEKG